MTARSTKMRRCGWIGIGTMGNPLSRRLMSAGFELRGYDPDPSAMERIVAAGATAAESPAMVAEMADVVFSMVPNDNVLLDIVSGPDGIARTIRPGSVHVDLSTVSPEASARVAEVMSGTGAAYLRCPVSGSTSNAESGSLTLLVSGPEDAVEDLSAILSVFGENRLYFGAGEEARIVKLMINMMVGVMPALIGEAVEFGVRQGLPRDTAIEAINNSRSCNPAWPLQERHAQKRRLEPDGDNGSRCQGHGSRHGDRQGPAHPSDADHDGPAILCHAAGRRRWRRRFLQGVHMAEMGR